MASKNIRKYVMTALLSALTCIATMVIQIPSPTGGYIHLGDGLVLLSGILLGPVYGCLAAGIGSMFADILSGYPQYAIATLFIKACAAAAGGFLYSRMPAPKSADLRVKFPGIIAAGICGGIIVTGGYFLFESILLGNGLAAAVTGIPGNLVQNLFGIIVSGFLLPLLIQTPYIRESLCSK